jgi:hypothetical protein
MSDLISLHQLSSPVVSHQVKTLSEEVDLVHNGRTWIRDTYNFDEA